MLLLHSSPGCSILVRLHIVFFFTATAPTQIYSLSLHDALPISRAHAPDRPAGRAGRRRSRGRPPCRRPDRRDRKSTRLNSSHTVISYAVFCLKKKKKEHESGIGYVSPLSTARDSQCLRSRRGAG